MPLQTAPEPFPSRDGPGVGVTRSLLNLDMTMVELGQC